jgi:hypothetical protein
LGKGGDAAGAVEQTVLGMDVKMDEGLGHVRLTLILYVKPRSNSSKLGLM